MARSFTFPSLLGPCCSQEAQLVLKGRGFLGFFAGCTCRAAWMGLGGFIFLGSFELAKKNLQSVDPVPQVEVVAPDRSVDRQLGSEPPVLVSFSCGLRLGARVGAAGWLKQVEWPMSQSLM